MAAQTPTTTNPSKICTITYKCEHSRHFKLEEITSEMTTALQENHNDVDCGEEASVVSSPSGSDDSSSSSSAPPSPYFIPTLERLSYRSLASTTSVDKDTSTTTAAAKGKDNLALLRVVDPDVLCPACITKESDVGVRGTEGLEAGGEDVEHLLSTDDGMREEVEGWWDLLDLEEMKKKDVRDDDDDDDDGKTVIMEALGGPRVEPWMFL
ncbi:MAG: hypothetical protein Q9168_005837 [Polycauliona sp. 1 TL-2023]